MCSPNRDGAGVAQLVEQLTCNQQVGGSIPFASSRDRVVNERSKAEIFWQPRRGRTAPALPFASEAGRYPSGQREQTVNLSAPAFGGSNPPLPIPCMQNMMIVESRASRCSARDCGACAALRKRGYAGIAQLVERQPSKLGVAGSNPVSRSNSRERFTLVTVFQSFEQFTGGALVAQSAEHFLGKEEVTGSIPVKGLSSLAERPAGAVLPRRGARSFALGF
jgi:hypothetical protein